MPVVNASVHTKGTLEPILDAQHQEANDVSTLEAERIQKQEKGIFSFFGWVKNKIRNTIKKWLGIDQNMNNGNGLLIGWILSGLFGIILFAAGSSAASHWLSAIIAPVFYLLAILLGVLALILFFIWLAKVSPAE